MVFYCCCNDVDCSGNLLIMFTFVLPLFVVLVGCVSCMFFVTAVLERDERERG